jgi:hypothetical protein
MRYYPAPEYMIPTKDLIIFMYSFHVVTAALVSGKGVVWESWEKDGLFSPDNIAGT